MYHAASQKYALSQIFIWFGLYYYYTDTRSITCLKILNLDVPNSPAPIELTGLFWPVLYLLYAGVHGCVHF